MVMVMVMVMMMTVLASSSSSPLVPSCVPSSPDPAHEASFSQERKEAAAERRAQARGTNALIDPADRGRGVSRGPNPGGRRAGSARSYENTHKPRGAPCLRRDPPAQSKLQILTDWLKRARECEVENLVSLPGHVKIELQLKWHWHTQTVREWHKIKSALEHKVATARLGKNGLRACGVQRRRGKSTSQGARLTYTTPGVPTAKSPLEGVLHKLALWFKRERDYNHEVKRKLILTQLKYHLEWEQDKQLHLKNTAHPGYNAEILKRVTKRLSTFRITQTLRQDAKWLEEFVLPRIKAHGRKGQRLSENMNKPLDAAKARLTWSTADRCQHLVARGLVVLFVFFFVVVCLFCSGSSREVPRRTSASSCPTPPSSSRQGRRRASWSWTRRPCG